MTPSLLPRRVVLAAAASWSLGVAIAVGRGEEEERKGARVFFRREPGDGELVLFQLRSFLAVGSHPTVQVVQACC
jgi:hypothetical protein